MIADDIDSFLGELRGAKKNKIRMKPKDTLFWAWSLFNYWRPVLTKSRENKLYKDGISGAYCELARL